MAIRKEQRQDGVRYQVDAYDAYGKRVRKRFRRLKEAQAFEKGLLFEAVGDTAPEAAIDDITFSELVTKFLEWCQKNRSPVTCKVYACTLKAHLVPRFGRLRLSEITPVMLERHRQQRQQTVSNLTANRDVSMVSVVYRQAIRWGHARVNPATGMEKLKEQQKPPRFFTFDEVERLLAVAERHVHYPLILTALHTGMRKRELLNLAWTDVDFEQGVIRIQNAKNYSYRYIDLTPELNAVLLTAKALHSGSHERVFEFRGNPIVSSIDRALHKLAQRAGLPPFRLHVLRHTFASHLAMEGESAYMIQMSLGHREPRSTQRYTHLTPDSYRSSNRRLRYGRKATQERDER